MYTPLSGMRVIDAGIWIAAPYCATILGDLGAEVIKIDRPEGDPWLRIAPYAYYAIQRNKKSIVLDLKKPQDYDILLKLVEISDIFIQNLRPTALKNLRITYEDLSAINPKLIYVSIKGFKSGSPYEHYPATDPALQAMSGLMSLQGEQGRPPIRALYAPVDFIAGVYAALGTLLALNRRERTGKGSLVEVPLLDAGLSMVANYWLNYWIMYNKLPPLLGSGHDSIVPYRVYEARDGWVYLGVQSDPAWKRLCEFLRIDPEIASRFETNEARVAAREEVDNLIQSRLKSYCVNELVGELTKRDIICVPVNTLDRLLEDRAITESGFILDVEYEGIGKLKVPRIPILIDGEYVGSLRSRAPFTGENSEEILELIGRRE